MANIATIHDRIRLLVEQKANNKNTVFAQKLGVSEANIRGYIRGVVPKADVLAKIVSSYDDISPAWLLTGEGEMLKSAPSGAMGASETAKTSEVTTKNVASAPTAPAPLNSDYHPLTAKGKKQNRVETAETTASPMALLVEKVAQQAEEIGRLKEQIRQLIAQKEHNAAAAPSSDVANVG